MFAHERTAVRFRSGDSQCAAWHYPGTNGMCVIMAGGLAVTKEPGTDAFATDFNQAGFAVLAFDYRHLGESGGVPRQIVPVRGQQADWQAAIAFARSLPGIDSDGLVLWGFSASGGHIFPVAARDRQLAGAIAVSPLADGLRAMPNASRHQTPLALIRFTARAIRDAWRGLTGGERLLVPLAGPPGTVTSLTTPDSLNGARALNPDNRYPDWQQEVAAGSALRIGFYRPGRHARRVRCPLLVLAFQDDGAAPSRPALTAAKRAPHGEALHLPGGHYESLMGGHERAVELQLAFLERLDADRAK